MLSQEPKDTLSQEESDFIDYWARNRLRRKKIFRQFLIGIPIGLLFVIPIVVNFASGWDKQASMVFNSGGLTLLIALLLIVIFVAIFSQQHKWDQYEQRYRELLARHSDELANLDTITPPAKPAQSAENNEILPDIKKF
jgi:hypothetical protein